MEALRPPGPPDPLLLSALLIGAAALAGEAVARWLKWPRVLGYTLAGWALVAFGHPLTLPLSDLPQLLIDLALALLLFELGSQIRLRWLLRNPALLLTILLESLLAAVAVFLALRALGLPPEAAAGGAILAVPASAAVAGSVARELHADGQVTRRMQVHTALNTLFGVLALQALKAVQLGGSDEPHLLEALRDLGQGFLVALLLAAILALAAARLTLHLDLRQEGALFLLLGMVLAAVGLARWWQASPLLVALLAGLTLRGISARAFVWPRHFGSAGALLVLLLFVLVGASWSPALLGLGLASGFALLAARGLARLAAVLLLARWSHLTALQGRALAVTLMPLGATTLVLTSDLLRDLPQLAEPLVPVMLSALLLAELLGPVAVQWALQAAGELPGELPYEPA